METETTPVAELDFWQVLTLLWRGRLFLLVLLVVAVAAAFAIPLARRKVYEGSGVVRIGQVAQAGQMVEPVARVVERIKLPDFQSAVIQAAGLPTDGKDPRSLLARQSLVANPVANSDVVQLQVHGYSENDVRSVLRAATETLARVHASLAAPALQNLQKKREFIDGELVQARDDLERLRQLAKEQQSRPEASRFPERVLTMTMIAAKTTDIRNLEQSSFALMEQMSSDRTYSTSAFGGIAAYPVPSRALRNAVVAAFAAFVLGALIVVAVGSGGVRVRRA